jgi:hypothetical protein
MSALDEVLKHVEITDNVPVDMVAYADKELAELRTRTTWRPIETAPKDGTQILVFGDNEISVAEWRTEQYVVGKSKYKTWVIPHTYQDEQGGEYTCDIPTHWMPLPEPPCNE